jgi:hypothetical protein
MRAMVLVLRAVDAANPNVPEVFLVARLVLLALFIYL